MKKCFNSNKYQIKSLASRSLIKKQVFNIMNITRSFSKNSFQVNIFHKKQSNVELGIYSKNLKYLSEDFSKKNDKNEKSEKSEKTEKNEKTDKAEKTDKIDKTDKTEKEDEDNEACKFLNQLQIYLDLKNLDITIGNF